MKQRDANNEVPATFNDAINMWSLESITCISLNHRLGLLNENYRDVNAEKLIKVNLKFPSCYEMFMSELKLQLIREFFVLGYDFEVMPTIWRYYETKAFKKLLNVYEGLTKQV